jgi:hypothetical protein
LKTQGKRDILKFKVTGVIPKTRLVLGKAAKSPLSPLNQNLLSRKLKFWERFIDIKTSGFLDTVITEIRRTQ